MKKILFVIFFLSFHAVAQTQSEQDQMNSQIQEIMKARAEMLKALMDDTGNGSLEKHLLEMMKNFDKDDDFGFGDMGGPIVGEYDWIENETSKTLKIKVKQIKDHPLDIKIQKGEIKIKGDVEAVEGSGKRKVTRKINFERSFTLPDDVDQTNPEFENKGGEMLIKFKKLSNKSSAKKVSSPKVAPVKQEERRPISPDKDDISI